MKRIELTPWEVSDLEMIAVGAFSPLEGFMCKKDYETVAGLILESRLLVQAGTIILALAGLTFLLALTRIYRHLVPRLTPLPEVQTAKGQGTGAPSNRIPGLSPGI